METRRDNLISTLAQTCGTRSRSTRPSPFLSAARPETSPGTFLTNRARSIPYQAPRPSPKGPGAGPGRPRGKCAYSRRTSPPRRRFHPTHDLSPSRARRRRATGPWPALLSSRPPRRRPPSWLWWGQPLPVSFWSQLADYGRNSAAKQGNRPTALCQSACMLVSYRR